MRSAHIRMQNVILGAYNVSFEFALTNAPIETLQLLAFFKGLVHPKLTFLYYLLTLMLFQTHVAFFFHWNAKVEFLLLK